MLTEHGLPVFLNPDVDAEAPLVIIYSPVSSARLQYTCEFIFNQVLKARFALTKDLIEFQNSHAIRINYSSGKISHSVQIIPHVILFESGVSEPTPLPRLKNGLLYFFENAFNQEPPAFHFDLFASVFYFISRYEEWQNFEKDSHQRFEARSSLLFKNGFHLKPVVDLWILEFKNHLQNLYRVQFPVLPFKVVSSIDVDNLFAYRHKGILRSAGGGIKDLLRGDFKSAWQRVSVLTGKAEDPFDMYSKISDFCSTHHIPLVYFFLFRTGTRYDRTVDPRSPAFKKVVSLVKRKGSLAGLHPSYDSAFQPSLLQEEVKKFSEVLGASVNLSRQHFLRFDIRSTPAHLLENGITTDFSMGFASSPGFRAGTAHPFFYYDLLKEAKSELLFVPFCAMDGAYLIYDQVQPADALTSMLDLCSEVKKTGGVFMTIFHERTFSDHLYPGFATLYKNLHLAVKEL